MSNQDLICIDCADIESVNGAIVDYMDERAGLRECDRCGYAVMTLYPVTR